MKMLKYTLFTLSLACLLISGVIFNFTPAEAAGPNPAVVFETSMGRIIIMLYPKEAPITVKNFLRYVDEGFYDGTVFHRVVTLDDFKKVGTQELPYAMVQGGGYDASLRPKRTHSPIVNESSKALVNKRGTIAMARGDNPDSATAQFFFNVEDNDVLDYKTIELQDYMKTKDRTRQVQPGYCAFGRVIRGMEVIDKISKVKRHKVRQHENVPVEPVIIKRAYRPQ